MYITIIATARAVSGTMSLRLRLTLECKLKLKNSNSNQLRGCAASTATENFPDTRPARPVNECERPS